MTSGETDDTGVLVVDDTGGVSWWSRRAAAVGIVDLPVGPGIVVHVDATRPQNVLAWTVEPNAAPGPLAIAVGDDALAGLIIELRRAGATVCVLADPKLTTPWAHRATVAAVDRWTMRTLYDGALLLDEAVAENDVGNPTTAKQLFVFGEYALFDLVARCVAGELTRSTVELVRRACIEADRMSLGADIAALAGELVDTPVIDDSEILSSLTEWHYAHGAAGAVRSSPTLGVEHQSIAMDTGYLDIAAVAPRIVAWNGANAAELLIEHHPATDLFVMTAYLADGVDPLCREVRELLAYAADQSTGSLVATMPTRVEDRTVIAELPARGRDIDSLTFGLVGADTDIRSLRNDWIGRGLVDVDRAMVEAWNFHRAANATLYAVTVDADDETLGLAKDDYDDQLSSAETAANNAKARLSDLLEAAEAATTDAADPTTTLMRARMSAVDAYLAELRTRSVTQLGEVLLAELVPPEWTDE